MKNSREQLVRRLYADIIDLPYPRKTMRARMPLADRAAQFAPFAALTGFESELAKAARPVQDQMILDDSVKEMLGSRLERAMAEGRKVCITYFVPDGERQGGVYRTAAGLIKRLDGFERRILLSDDTRVPLDSVLDVTEEDS